MKVNKTLYYWSGANFGDELNKYLFEKVFDVQFNYCNDILSADYIAIGSVLAMYNIKSFGSKIHFIRESLLRKKINLKKLTVLGSGFHYWSDEHKIEFPRKMDFKIVRGKLTESYLRKHGFLRENVLLGDLGLLCPYMIGKSAKKYKLGIIPHYLDFSSPIIYDIYKKYGRDKCIIINVQDDVETVIGQITECENIISSSLHGLIAADSFYIPNVWFENTFRRYSHSSEKNLWRFKFRDYYSIYDINEIDPVNILDIMDINVTTIEETYKVKKEAVEKKQQELHTYCKEILNDM